MTYNEDDFLMISGIQHFIFCRRQWALIHIEQQWSDNLRTVEGDIVHQNVHSLSQEKRNNVITTRGMPIHSATLGLSGECDVVEFHKSSDGVRIANYTELYKAIPVEYKRGKPKEHDADILQLAAQAHCLEEMLCTTVECGYLYYSEIKRRVKVEFTPEIRDRLKQVCEDMHICFKRKHTPKVKRSKGCNACSLKDTCLPVLSKDRSAKQYLKERVGE